MEVTSQISHSSIRIYINGILHLLIVREKFLGLSSWLFKKENMYYIEIRLIDGSLNVDYDRLDLWEKVLLELEKIR